MKHRFELGEVVKDKITGFEGVAMVRAEYFTDCTHYGLCARSLENGKTIDWQWFDETRLVKADKMKVTKEPRAGEKPTRLIPTGGPCPAGPEA